MLARRYEARTLTEALALVRQDLGGDAVVLYSRERSWPLLRRWLGRGAEVIAMTPLLPEPRVASRPPNPDPATAVNRRSDANGSNGGMQQPSLNGEGLSTLLRQPPVTSATPTVYEPATDRGMPKGIPAPLTYRERAPQVVCAAPIRVARGRCRRVALIGPPGAGKTTTAAKIASAHILRGHSVGLIAADTSRPGTESQLADYARALGASFLVAPDPEAVARAREQHAACSLMLADLPGVHPRRPGRVAAVRRLLEEVRPHEIHLVLSATTSVGVLADLQEGLAALSPSRAIMTRVDEVSAARLAVVLGALSLPLAYIGCGPNVASDLIPARSRQAAAWLGTDRQALRASAFAVRVEPRSTAHTGGAVR